MLKVMANLAQIPVQV